MPGPLAGLRVVEIACIGPGPFAGMLLADLGADIIRVDRVDGAGQMRTDGASHRVLDRGRRSVAIDLKDARGADLVLRLATDSDALIEGMRPGAMERIGLGPNALLAANPRLVYARITGWGQDGPDAQRAGHDLNYIALSGALEPISAPGGGPPVAPLNMLGDFGGGGMLLAFGIVSALLHARTTGEGQVVDASILDGTALLTAMHHSLVASGMWSAPRGKNLFDGGAPFYGVYECADGRWLTVGAIEAKFYAELVEGLGLSAEMWPQLQFDAAQWPRYRELIARRIATRTQDEWVETFRGRDACVAPVLTPELARGHPHLAHRGVYEYLDGLVHPAPAPRFSKTPGQLRAHAPTVGEDSRQVLTGMGLEADLIADLVRSGVVRSA